MLNRTNTLITIAMLATGTLTPIASTAIAQPCVGEWDSQFSVATMANGPQAVVIFDSGTGPTLHVGAGPRVLRLDNGRWVQLGTNFLANLTGPTTGGGGDIRALAVFNDGNGAKLYAAGTFTRAPGGVVTRDIARWNGTAWEGFGPGTTTGSSPTRGITNYSLPSSPGVHFVLAMTVHDEDGSGPIAPALYCAGRFSGAGTTTASSIVKWTGSAWQPLDIGLTSGETAYAMHSTDLDGDGPVPPTLLVGGSFFGAGGVGNTNFCAAWNGPNGWAALGIPLPTQVRALGSFDPDGVGPSPRKIIAGLQANEYLYELDQTNGVWTTFQGGVNNVPLSMLTIPHDTGDELIVGGGFTTVGGDTTARSAARWTQADGWSTVGNDLYTLCTAIGQPGAAPSPTAMAMFDPDGAGPLASRLHVFGQWQINGDLVAMQNSASLNTDTNTWEALSLGQGCSSSMPGLCVFDEDGSGPLPARIFASYYGILGSAQGSTVAGWNGATRAWEPLGGCSTLEPGSLFVANDGTADRLFMGGAGSFGVPPGLELKVRRNDTWESFPGPDGPSVFVQAACGVDFDGAGGQPGQIFAVRHTGQSDIHVIRWNGASWSVIPGFFEDAATTSVALTVVNTGDGPTLYAHGRFSTIGGAPFNNIARFDPATATWQPVGGGVPGYLFARPVAATVNGGTRLTVAGNSATAVNSGFLASFDGAAWTSHLTDGRVNGPIYSIANFSDGSGEKLFIVGNFTTLDGATTSRDILTFDGASTFAAYGPGLMPGGGASIALPFNDGNGSALWITNQHGIAPVSNGLAVLRAASCRCQPADIAADDGTPLPTDTSAHPNAGVNEGDFNSFFMGFFDAAPNCDIANDDGTPLPPFGSAGTNNGVNEGDYNAFFMTFFDGCW